ncbi:hypothetical protein I3842_03G084300 [Carya illinoinensis]|uniref:Uncharacterized protein n=1 Tax=Carya illinoinensis TaxID=32201 RepID=A0A922FE20_CARIL|nr:hypothetical protein I3842_03G084300 [Carya illinoinensis]
MDVTDHEQKRGESSKNLRVHFDVPPTVYPSNHHQRSGSTPSSDSSLDLDAIENVLDSLPPQEFKKSTLEMQEATSSADHSSPPPPPPPVGSNQSGSAPQSALQVMPGRPSGYDPNRIPSSIFTTRPTTAMDWSTASNESLFSIHIGNSSFSREHFIMLNRSGELPRTDELTGLPTTLPSVSETGEDKSETANAEKDAEVIQGSGQSGNGAWWGSSPNNMKEKTSPKDVGARNYNATSYRSDESSHSAHSFNFPLLAGDSGLSSPATLDMEKQHLQQQLPPQNPQIMSSKRGWNNMFCCFSFRSRYWTC